MGKDFLTSSNWDFRLVISASKVYIFLEMSDRFGLAGTGTLFGTESSSKLA